MIEVAFDIDNGTTSFRDTVRAEDIVRAVTVAETRYPEHDIGLALPIDPDTFFVGDGERMTATLDLTGGRQE